FSSAPAGSSEGLGTTDHVEPFQCSMRLWALVPVSLPTAQTLLAATTTSPCKRVSSVAGRAADGTIDQAEPVKCSTRARKGPLPTREKPTLQASVELTLATPSSSLKFDPVTLGLGTTWNPEAASAVPSVAAPASSPIRLRMCRCRRSCRSMRCLRGERARTGTGSYRPVSGSHRGGRADVTDAQRDLAQPPAPRGRPHRLRPGVESCTSAQWSGG